jgi:hypothetical protein
MYQRYQVVWIGLLLLIVALVDGTPLRGQSRLSPVLRVLREDDDEAPPPPVADEEEYDDEYMADEEYTDDDKQYKKGDKEETYYPSSPPAFSSNVFEGDETDTNNQDNNWQLQNACRAASRDVFIESSVSIKAKYSYEIQTTSQTLNDEKVVDEAVKDYLEQAYILAYCTDNNRRSLASSSFQPGDVWSIKRGKSEINTDSACEPSQPDAYCFPMTGTVELSMNPEYGDQEAASETVKSDISAAFSNGQVLTMAQETDQSILSLASEADAAGNDEATDQPQPVNDKSVEHTEGMKTGGKVTLSLFAVCLVAVIGYVGYKKYFGGEVFKSQHHHQPNQVRGPSSRGGFFSSLTDSLKEIHDNVSKKMEIPTPSSRTRRPLSGQRGRRSRNRQATVRDDPNIMIADTTDSHSAAEGAGTELVLADLQDTSQSSPVEFVIPSNMLQKSKNKNKFTPETLPADDEYSRPNDISWDYSLGQVSFGGDVQVMVDDASSYASSVNLFRPKSRPYKTPDTLDL